MHPLGDSAHLHSRGHDCNTKLECKRLQIRQRLPTPMRHASGNSWQCVCRRGRLERRFPNGHIAIERVCISTA
eukprot:1599290-Pyramimonas_sp.AAC.1